MVKNYDRKRLLVEQIHLYLAYNYESEVLGWTESFIFGLELGMQRSF